MFKNRRSVVLWRTWQVVRMTMKKEVGQYEEEGTSGFQTKEAGHKMACMASFHCCTHIHVRKTTLGWYILNVQGMIGSFQVEIQRTCFHFFLSVYLYFKHILQLKYISFCTKAQINVVLRTDPPENGSDVSSVILLACQIYFFMSMSSLSSLGNQCWWKACWSNQKTGSCPPAV